MNSAEVLFSAMGLDHLIDERAFAHEAAGTLVNPAGIRVMCASRELARSLLFVIEKERPGAGRTVHKSAGRAAGRGVATQLDEDLARRAKPGLSALPLDVCLILIERYLALHGWGRLKLDLAQADAHGLVIARLEKSFFVEATADETGFADALLAGWLQGFFEYLTGEPLGCEEIACARQGAPECTFVLTAQERLDAIRPALGREDAAAILARLMS